MRTLSRNEQRLEVDDCFPGCLLFETKPRKLKRAFKPLGVVFLTACFAAYVSHTFQSDRSCDPNIKINENHDKKFQCMEQSATELISSLQNIQDDLCGVKTMVKGGLSNEMLSQTNEIVKKQLSKYDADKTGLTDYALENLGGCVLSTRDTVTFNEGTPSLTIFGVPVMTLVTEPRSIIQPKVTPGDCWAIEGQKGSAVIQLVTDIVVTGMSLEHIPVSLSPTGDISSAPKQFSLSGLTNLDDKNPHKFGTFVYDKTGPAVQTFTVQEQTSRTFKIVEVNIESNHGHPKFTCIYRVRIHGRPPDDGLK